jgi:TolB-like protein
VLPFENLSGDEAADPFTNGIHDDIITHLSMVGDLKVISRMSVMEYRGRTANLREIAEELDVGTILEGGVQRAGDRVRINVQLINARTDEHLWAETFDRALTAENVFSIQSEIARSVAQALRAELSPEEERRVDARPTDNLEAYDYYTRALDLPGGVYGDLPLKIQLLERAIELDPDFVQAHTVLSAYHIWMYHLGRDPTPERLAQAKATAERAIDLDPAFYRAHHALGEYYYLGHRDYPRALAEFRAAAALNPNADAPIRYIGAIQRRTGEWEEALANIQRAAELNPRSVGSIEELAVTYQLLRRYEDPRRTRAKGLRVTRLQPLSRGLGRCLRRVGPQVRRDSRGTDGCRAATCL